MPFLILFVFWPILEIVTFFAVADEAGLLTAICLIVLAGVCGSFLLRYQSLQALMTAGDALRARRLPSQELFDAACLIGAAVLLIIPGFLSDILALLLLIAPFRNKFRDVLRERGGLKQGDIIEAEFERVDNDNEHISKG